MGGSGEIGNSSSKSKGISQSKKIRLLQLSRPRRASRDSAQEVRLHARVPHS